MPPIPIINYAVNFSTNTNGGRITVQLQNGQHVPLPLNSIEEEIMALAMLSKSGVVYDVASNSLILPWRPAGT